MSPNETTKTLERGTIYFVLRPRVERDEPEGEEDVQNLFMILAPDDDDAFRLTLIGRQELPDPSERGTARFWGFVEEVRTRPDRLGERFESEEYETKTRGVRELPAARPVGEGIYRIVRHEDHTHLVYALELPEEIGPLHRDLNIERDASYIVTVKDPEKSSPPGAGLGSDQEADYPEELQGLFGELRFVPADPPELLDYEGAEFVLVSSAEDPVAQLDVELEADSGEAARAAIFEELGMSREEHPTEPLEEGEWA